MSIKVAAGKFLGKRTFNKLRDESLDGVVHQERILHELVQTAKDTHFGKEHRFNGINNAADFTQAVPVRDYEQLASYIQMAKSGTPDVLWPGKPLYFCKTSGTTSGTKNIPLTKASMPNHINSAKNALLNYVGETGKGNFIDGKMIFLQGSPVLDYLESGIPYGRLSGIVANHVPSYLQRNRMPSYDTNCIEDWETKVKRIVEETASQNMTLISGIPSWVQMYFEMMLEYTGKKTIREVFPHFELFPFGGVNFSPYKQRFKELIGDDVDSIELYPASEGFLAFQDSQTEEGLRLNVNSGIYTSKKMRNDIHFRK